MLTGAREPWSVVYAADGLRSEAHRWPRQMDIMEAMNLKQLEAFIAAVDHGGFRPAQSVCTSQTQACRSRYASWKPTSVVLFETDARNVKLTAAGRELVPEARALLRVQDRFRSRAEDLSAGRSGRVRVACFPVHIRCLLALATNCCQLDIARVSLEQHYSEVGFQLAYLLLQA